MLTLNQITESIFNENSYLYFLIADYTIEKEEIKKEDFITKREIIEPIVLDVIDYLKDGKEYEEKKDLAYEWASNRVDIMNWRLYDSVKYFAQYVDDLIEKSFEPANLTSLIQNAQTRAYEEFAVLVLDLMENNSEE